VLAEGSESFRERASPLLSARELIFDGLQSRQALRYSLLKACRTLK
jgi:hypothetical protein